MNKNVKIWGPGDEEEGGEEGGEDGGGDTPDAA